MKALITGASSGIGRDMARIFANRYDELVLVGRNEERLNELKKELHQTGAAVIKVVATDLSVAENCKKLYEDNKEVDLLVNNAGFGDFGEFAATDLDKDLTMINTNIVALHILTKLYLKDMVERDDGHILNVASIAGFMPGPLMATYYATKGYVVRLSEAIRQELKKKKSKVKISILCPGPVSTNFEKTSDIGFKFNGISSKKVAKCAADNLNKFYIVPTLKIKAARFGAKALPSGLTAKVVHKIQSTKKKV